MRLPLLILLLAATLPLPMASAAESTPVKPAQAAEQIASGIQLLDVRTREEWNEGYIKGAKLVPVSTESFAAQAAKVLDPEKPVLVYCRSGTRSARAVKLLDEAGFKDVRNMTGGIVAWEKEGHPVVKPDTGGKAAK